MVDADTTENQTDASLEEAIVTYDFGNGASVTVGKDALLPRFRGV